MVVDQGFQLRYNLHISAPLSHGLLLHPLASQQPLLIVVPEEVEVLVQVVVEPEALVAGDAL